MSKQRDLQLDKCIISQLWYVATIIHQHQLFDRSIVETLKEKIIACEQDRFWDQRWIAYNLSQLVERNSEIQEKLDHEEFACTLRMLDTRLSRKTKEELIRLFEAVQAAAHETEVPTGQLSEESLECLQINILNDPTSIQWIIDRLLCIWLPATFSHTESILQGVFFHSIRQILSKIQANAAGDTNLGILLSILSKLNLTEAKEEELLAWMFPALRKTVNSDDVELALWCGKNRKIFQAWHEFLDESYARCGQLDNLEKALKVFNIIIETSENSTVLNTNEIYKRILKRETHWLIDILDLCAVLLINEKYEQVEKLLATSGFMNFWLPLLFKLWKEKSQNCADISNALRFVMNNVREIAGNDATLNYLMNSMAIHLKVLDYLRKNHFINAIDIETKRPHVLRVYDSKNILNLLQIHNVLIVLKMAMDEHEMPYEEINALLSNHDSSKNIFQAYHAMLRALKGILNCKACNKSARVQEDFNELEKLLGSLFPLDLRIQTLQNIFSMLFLRREDFADSDSILNNTDDMEPSCKRTENLNGIKNPVHNSIEFVCNRYAIQEVLACLKRSLMALELEYVEQKNDGKLSADFCEALEKNISYVSKVLADATWRLELLTDTESIKKFQTLELEKTNKSKNRITFRNERPEYSIHSKNKIIFYKSIENFSGKSEFIKSDLDGSFESGSQGSTGSRRRKRSKNQASPLNEASTNLLRNSEDRDYTLHCMLASTQSLILQCLWKSDYEGASRVIEMFDMKNNRTMGEIFFSQAIQAFRREMKAQWSSVDSVDSPDTSDERTLENIRKAVQDGFQASRTTGQIETFLAAQESSLRLIHSKKTSTKAILSMASLDLALTMPPTRQDFINFGDVTMKYLESSQQHLNSRYHTFFGTVYKLLLKDKQNLTVQQFLRDASISLSMEEAHERNEFWTHLMKNVEAFKDSSITEPRDVEHASSNFNLCDKHFQEIISMCNNGEVYLPRVYAYLKMLRTIVPENNGRNFQFLETSLDTFIGDQIFRLNIEFDEIESVASKLRVNLVHSILVNCCPKLPCGPGIRPANSKTWGFVVLNKLEEENDYLDRTPPEPNECVHGILSELIEAVQEEISPSKKLSRENAKDILKVDEIREILAKTRTIATLDLSNLSFGHQTLAFFINIWNLLMMHAILEIWSEDPPIEDLRHEIALSSVGYDIGDLGTVSLSALRSKLLKESRSWVTQYFPRTEELNEAAWEDLDVPYEPKVLFAMINEYTASPIIRVYSTESLEDDLKAAMTDYIEYYQERENEGFNQNVISPNLIVEIYNEATTSRIYEKDAVAVEIEKNPPCYSYKISFSYEEKATTRGGEEETSRTEAFPWQNRIVKANLLEYLEGRCWLVSYLVQRIHEESPTILHSTCENMDRMAALENLLKSPWNSNLKCLYENNETVSALLKITATSNTWKVFRSLLATNEASKCLKILNALPDYLIFRKIEVQRLRDEILVKLVTDSSDLKYTEILKYVYQIRDENVLAQMIFENVNRCSVKVCQESLLHILSHRNKEEFPSHCTSRMNEILCRVTVFYKILPYCLKKRSENDEDNWHNVRYHEEKMNPVRIVKSLIEANQYELCLEWLEHQAISSEIHSLITEDFLVGLLTNDDVEFKHSLKLLRALPSKKSLKLCKNVISRLESMTALRFVIQYLENNKMSDTENYQLISLGIDILAQLEPKERRSYTHLIEQPLLMLEQLLMNSRFDSLQRIVAAVRENILQEHTIDFDATVRFYAKKSLDFRVAVQLDPIEKIKDVSISSNKSQSADFVMPVNIPTKEEWVPNDMARECSCCRDVIFSMFNRRHHCRRCGRVVCGACSPQRMRLPNYPSSVPVRVCNDCKLQSLVQLQTAASTPSSEIVDCWRLNVDETYNKTLRDEFSFENAPNMSLCLAILSLHSDHEAYSDFLLDRCDEMKCLLRPDSKGRVNPEIDHALIIKMIRSLLVAAKVKYAKLGLNIGLTHCDRFLSQVDLIATLVNSDCSYLIPRIDKEDHLDDHTLRRLRDMLTEKEQWTLALDVSTKTGLDTQGVWAAWGTVCLKVGYYERAREKFSYCFEKVLRETHDDWVILSHTGEVSSTETRRSSDDSKQRITSKSQEGVKSRPIKDPPLLTEILQILEKINPSDSYSHSNGKSRCTGAQEIMNTLNSLKPISQRALAVGESLLDMRNIRYQESLYYLMMYGSYGSILGFFVRHEEYDKCLTYVLDNEVEPEVFMNNIFMPSLKNGAVGKLCETMSSKDPSLMAFKKYLIYTCRMLEKKKYLHTLLQMQLFMKDYVRASMTCIRFYVTKASTYEDLCARSHHLAEAQKYLEMELQLANFGRSRRKSTSSSQSGQSISLNFEMDPSDIDRHVNTIARQIELAKFLRDCERKGTSIGKFINKLPYTETESPSIKHVPTLFGNHQEKTHLAALAILCGQNVEEGFGITFRIMQDHNLQPQKVYSIVGHILASDLNISSIEQLVRCCRSSGAADSITISDRVLSHCVKVMVDCSRADFAQNSADQIDTLIRLIKDVELKIDSYIDAKQLKAAYLLAVKHSRARDIQKILREAERQGQMAIKSICTRWLEQTQKPQSNL